MTATKEKKLPAEVTKVGNLTREPELRFGKEKGTPFTRFGLAVEVPVTPGEWSGERRTEFYEVSCFGSLAENAAASLTKGSRAIVKGRPELDHWKDSDDKQRTTKRIVANTVGAELRFATAEITRTQRAKTNPDEHSSEQGELEEPF